MNAPAPDSGRPDLEALNALDVTADALHALVGAMERLHGSPVDGPPGQANPSHLNGLAHGIILLSRGLLPLLPCYRRAFLRAHSPKPSSTSPNSQPALPRLRSAR